MALFHCLVPAGSLDADTRAALATAITTIHSTVMYAPSGLVNVVFTEYEPTAFYTAGRPNTVSVINATIRAGHDRERRAQLLTQLSQSWSSITGQDLRQLWLCLNEVDPTSSMEGGMILPAFGEEAVWARQNNQRIEELRSGY